MSRRNLTSNKRSFRVNPKTFLNKVTDSPIDVEINDGVNPVYTIKVDPLTARVKSTDNLPSTVDVGTSRPTTTREFDLQ